MIAPPPPPAAIVYLSQAAIVADGKTDECDRLQALFDRSSSGQPLEVVNDLPGRLLTRGNAVWPNTTVRTMPGCTWCLSPGSTRPILRNRHILASWPVGAHRQDGEISMGPTRPDDAHPPSDEGHGDYNIRLIGGIYDGNRRSGGWPNDGRTPTNAHPVLGRDNMMVCALEFLGVEHLSLEGVHVYDSPTLAIHIANVIDVVADDCDIACPGMVYGSNQDGFHINGPANDISITRMHLRQTGDDAMAIASDDSMESTTEGNQALFFGMGTGWGPIIHMRAHGIFLDRCSSGIRTLSATQPIDDVILDDVHGSCSYGCILMDKYLFNHDGGNIGHFALEHIHLAVLGPVYAGAAPGFSAPTSLPNDVILCNTSTADLTLKDVTIDSTNGSRLLHIMAGDISALSVDHLTFADTSPGNDGIILIQADAPAALGSVKLHDIEWSSTHKQCGTLLNHQGSFHDLRQSQVVIPSGVQVLAGGQPHG